MRILVTGAAGFIGAALSLELARRGHTVAGIDNINAYYDPRLKIDRLRHAGFDIDAASLPVARTVPAAGSCRNEVEYPDIPYGVTMKSILFPHLSFERLDITDADSLEKFWKEFRPEVCISLAAQAGVRYSIDNPRSYIESNVVGFLNLIECARHCGIGHFIYASSSSVYGANAKIPFSEDDRTDAPVSLYATTKKSDELMASVYARLYGIPMTGLRFFTVYGPWGRPDMAPMLFADAISEGRPLKVFNEGRMSRDFTYIDDIVEGIVRIAETSAEPGRDRVYNIGRGKPTPLLKFIECMQQALGASTPLEMMPMQPGDVERTWADTSRLARDYGYTPAVSIEEGTRRFAEWYRSRR